MVDLIDLREAASVVGDSYRRLGFGEAKTMAKTHLLFGGSHTLHAVGGFTGNSVGVKTWAHTAGGATPLLELWDAESGALKAVIEAFALGQMRTASTCAVATDLLANPDASVMAMLGTGKQAMAQVAAVCAVRSIETVYVWSPSADSRESFANRLASEVPEVEVLLADSAKAAVRGAQVATAATRARVPFLEAADFQPGTHLNAIGAISPERAELDRDVLEAASAIVVDSRDSTKRLSAELADFAESHGKATDDWDWVDELSDIAAGTRPTPPAGGLTIFKAMGLGLSDVALGERIHELAVEQALGRAIGSPTLAKPRLFTTKISD